MRTASRSPRSAASATAESAAAARTAASGTRAGPDPKSVAEGGEAGTSARTSAGSKERRAPFILLPRLVSHPTVSEKSLVLSPKLFMSSSPSLCIRVSITLAIGVPGSALRCMLPARRPFAPPTTNSGQRL